MFKSSWTIGHVAGIPIKLHISLLLVLPFFTWIIGTNVKIFTESLDIAVDSLVLNTYLLGFLLGIGLFTSVALHELGHSLVALRRGSTIRSITLMLLGGVAQLEDMDKTPKNELAIAIAGPFVSLTLAFLLIGLQSLVPSGLPDLRLFLLYLGQMNLFLAIFNLFPAFPTDGGRVFRALLARRFSRLYATKIAVTLGQVFAVLFGLLGILSGNIILILIAIFIYIAATQEYQTGLLQDTLAGFKVADLMTEDVVTVPKDLSVSELLDIMYDKRHGGYPVLDDDSDSVVGCVTMEDIQKIEREKSEQHVVADIMSTKLYKAEPNDDISEVLKTMSQKGIGRLFVFEDDQLVGIITRSDIIKGFQLRKIEKTALSE